MFYIVTYLLTKESSNINFFFAEIWRILQSWFFFHFHLDGGSLTLVNAFVQLLYVDYLIGEALAEFGFIV
jgi:hypothetical protein